MMRRPGRLVLSACVLSAAAAFSCATQGTAVKGADTEVPSQAPSKPAADLTPYYPLSIGNEWIYKGSLLGQPQTSKVTIIANEGPVFIDSKGGRLMFDREGLRDAKRYLIKNPPAKGTSWVSVTSLTSTERFEIVDDGAKVSVPAGTFENCLVVRATNKIDAKKSLLTVWTFAPGVGIALIETFLDRDGKDMLPQGRFELVSYSVKGAKK